MRLQQLRERLDRETAGITALNALAARTGIPRAYLAVAGGLLGAVVLLSGVGVRFFAVCVGAAYPAFASLKCIDTLLSTSTLAPREAAQWLSYWVIFAAFSLVEGLAFLLPWVPFYFAAKVCFLLFCQLPQFRGAEFIYTRFIKPAYDTYGPRVEARVAHVTGATSGLVKDLVGAPGGGAGAGAEGSAAFVRPRRDSADIAAVRARDVFGEARPSTR